MTDTKPPKVAPADAPPPGKDENAGKQRSDAIFFYAAAGLLIVIICMLMVLWLRTRSRLLQTQERLREVTPVWEATKATQRPEVAAMLARLAQMGEEEAAPLRDRDALEPRTVILDGAETDALILPADQAEALGLQAGDVILVLPPPATAPGDS
jgi:hypothetical protein